MIEASGPVQDNMVANDLAEEGRAGNVGQPQSRGDAARRHPAAHSQIQADQARDSQARDSQAPNSQAPNSQACDSQKCDSQKCDSQAQTAKRDSQARDSRASNSQARSQAPTTGRDGRARNGPVGNREAGVVTVRYFAGARAAAGGVSTEVIAAATLNDLVQRITDRHGEQLGRVLKSAAFLVDGLSRHDGNLALPPGSTVDVLPPFAGG